MRHDQGPPTGINHRAGKTTQRFTAALHACRGRVAARSAGIAGGQHDQIGVQFEIKDLTAVEQAVAVATAQRGHEGGLRQAGRGLRQEAVGREIEHFVVGKIGSRLYPFVGKGSADDVLLSRCATDTGTDQTDLVGRIGKGRHL